MEVIKYSDEWKEKWDGFVLESNNGTMFHLQKFLDYHTPGKFRFDHLIFLKKGNIFAVLPGAIKNGVFESPIGASYGSIVTKDVKFADALEIISSFPAAVRYIIPAIANPTTPKIPTIAR